MDYREEPDYLARKSTGGLDPNDPAVEAVRGGAMISVPATERDSMEKKRQQFRRLARSEGWQAVTRWEQEEGRLYVWREDPGESVAVRAAATMEQQRWAQGQTPTDL